MYVDDGCGDTEHMTQEGVVPQGQGPVKFGFFLQLSEYVGFPAWSGCWQSQGRRVGLGVTESRQGEGARVWCRTGDMDTRDGDPYFKGTQPGLQGL